MPRVVNPLDRLRGGGGARALGGVEVIARLTSGVSLDQAQAQMTPIAASIAATNGAASSSRTGLRAAIGVLSHDLTN